MTRALIAGAMIAVSMIAVVAALFAFGVLDLEAEAPERILVILTAPDAESVEVATVAFVLKSDGSAPVVLDTTAPAVVPDTTARNAREAYPFVGGEGAAKVLSRQTGAQRLPWIVLPSARWSELIDDSEPLSVVVPEEVSVYRDGLLVVLDDGMQRLSGPQAVALLSSVDPLSGESQDDVVQQAAEGLSELVRAQPEILQEAVEADDATSSLSERQLEAFVRAR